MSDQTKETKAIRAEHASVKFELSAEAELGARIAIADELQQAVANAGAGVALMVTPRSRLVLRDALRLYWTALAEEVSGAHPGDRT